MHVRVILLGLLIATGNLVPAHAQTPPRPNIVFFYADDLGFGDLGCYGHTRLRTPNLDRLAAEGTRFTQFYVSHCVCSPTRASAITGHYPSRWNIYAHIAWLDENIKRGMPHWLSADASSMPRALQQAGYRTAMIGKWHLGGGSGRIFRGKPINSADAPLVSSYGFDHVRATFGNAPTWRNAEPVDAPHEVYPYDDEGWTTWSSRAIADEAIRFLDDHQSNHADRPYMMNIWFRDPHVPFKPTDTMRAPYRDVPEPQQTYFAVVTHMDAQIGRVLDRLDALGLRDNTLVIFSSDNGAASGEGGSTGGLRGWKWHLHEGGIRVPLIVRWPGVVPARRIDTKSVLNIVDFVPTFCALAGASMPEGYKPDGADITAALRGEPFERGKPMFWHNPTVSNRPTLAVRDGEWKLLLESGTDRVELFHLLADPNERHDLAAEQPGRVAALKQKLRAWHTSLPPPIPTAGR